MTLDEARAAIGARVVYAATGRGWPPMEGTIVAVGLKMVHVDFQETTRAVLPGRVTLA